MEEYKEVSLQYKRKGIFFMAITVDTIQLKFNVKPSYEQQEIPSDTPHDPAFSIFLVSLLGVVTFLW